MCKQNLSDRSEMSLFKRIVSAGILLALNLIPHAYALQPTFQVPKKAKEVALKYIELKVLDRAERYTLLSEIDRKSINKVEWISSAKKKLVHHFVSEHEKCSIISANKGRLIHGADSIDFRVKIVGPDYLSDDSIFPILDEPYTGQIDSTHLEKLPQREFKKTITLRQEQGDWRVFINIEGARARTKANKLLKQKQYDAALSLLAKQYQDQYVKHMVKKIKATKLSQKIQTENIRVEQSQLLEDWLEIKIDVINNSKLPIGKMFGRVIALNKKGDEITSAYMLCEFKDEHGPLSPGRKQSTSQSFMKDRFPCDWCKEVRIVIEGAYEAQ